MALIDFILNLAALLLWLNWRAAKSDPLGKRTPATLIGTLRRADARAAGRWQLPAVLGGLLLLRALFYWQIGSALKPVWAGKLDLGAIVLSIPCHESWSGLGRIIIFSFCSFAILLAVFYSWLIILSILGGPEPVQALVRVQLGRPNRWPVAVKWLLPFLLCSTAWWLASWLLAWLHIIPAPGAASRRLAGAAIIGLEPYPTLKFLFGALLSLYLLNSYIYFGKHPFWAYVNAVSQNLLRPIRIIPLRVGRVDFAPLIGIAAVFLLAQGAGYILARLYTHLAA